MGRAGLAGLYPDLNNRSQASSNNRSVFDRIHLPKPKSFPSIEGYCAVWAHQAAQSTAHHSRLSRDLSGGFGSTA